MDSALERGRKAVREVDPQLEEILSERYDGILPEFSESLIEMAYGRIYSRPGLDVKTRFIATIAALTAQGAQTLPQLRINIRNALKVGVTQREISEVIFQMALYGGLPSMINALNAAKEIFEEEAGKA
ncbi:MULTISPECIES: carboxymuconolactone decarboxylase family protein [Shewanella]|uniref:carboxymuconolactone decarboxylase family protein n=1 Tax=Shewanella TaxID=22 RepID=UPI001C65DB58|nr:MULTISPECIES: carboxymuconolactone decarboxylase family protein [Shewanella]MCG9747262.1 carboxymuconolactone decarboxylase family protein [Shewanella sp. Isolate8]MCL2908812.1 carboxymuconolactone decarboxylase family protein [Shewanella aquimarina]QYJ92776.1 carboxymuconolactone decarboxylase family protein [Shewanella spartinae]